MLHTEIPGRAQVDRSLAHRGPCSVSIYVATDPVSSGEAERIEFKNLAAEAVQQLHDAGVPTRDRTGQGRTLTDVVEVARAATFGAVDTVLVDIDAVVPGTVYEGTGAVTVRFVPEDATSYGVIDEIARRVWLTGGRVLAVREDEVPSDQGVAAILRYAG